MALPSPNLDDRTFQDLVREARAKIPQYCPEWTDHNLSDPGITLIELFAWMVDTLLYRLNKVPDKNYIKFMDLIGIRLSPPVPAKVDVTFRLSAPQQGEVTIPRGTEVATLRTETKESIPFTTDADLVITPPNMAYALTSFEGRIFKDCMTALKNPDKHVAIFQDVPEENNALYLGYEENLRSQTLTLSIKCKSEGIGVDPNNPPLSWEFWDEDFSKWSALRLEKDTTGGLNANGKVVLHIPHGCTMSEIDGQSACWIRCRAIEPSEGQSSYSSSPKIIGIKSDCTGGTVPTSNAQRINAEILGKSDGTSGQRFVLHNSPVLAREEGETIEVQGIDGNYEPWQEVSDFSDSGPDDPHFVCDSVSGEIQFGPAIKQPSGQELQYGKIPVNGSRIQFTSYRFGGGVIGNVGEGTITVMKSSIPYIASVVNWQAARGGTDSESMKSAKMRAPQALRSRSSAVTAEDFEYLAVEASSLVARAKCLSPGDAGSGQELLPGVVRLMLVPKISQTDRIIPEEELDLTKQIREEVHSYLDERRLLGTRLEIARPKYVPVSVEAHIRSKVNTDPATVATKIEKELYRYINPVCGGPDGDGWPFGRGISVSEIYATIQGTEGVDYIEELKVFPIDAETGERQSAANQTSIPADSLICSRAHEITVR